MLKAVATVFPQILPTGTTNFRVCQDVDTIWGWEQNKGQVQLISYYFRACMCIVLLAVLARTNVKSALDHDKSTHCTIKCSYNHNNKWFQQVSLHTEVLLVWLNRWMLSHANHAWEVFEGGVYFVQLEPDKSLQKQFKGRGEFKEILYMHY